MKKSLLLFVCLIMASGFSACGGGDGGGYSLADFDADGDQIFCEKLDECGFLDGTVEECVIENNEVVLSESDCPDFNSEAAQGCIDELESMDCEFSNPAPNCDIVCGSV